MPELKRRKSQGSEDGGITWGEASTSAQRLGLMLPQTVTYRSQGAGALEGGTASARDT